MRNRSEAPPWVRRRYTGSVERKPPMSGNALKSHSGRKSVTRVLTWTCLALIPALAILTLSTGLLPALTTDTPSGLPGGLQVADTRALTAQGDDVASIGKTG